MEKKKTTEVEYDLSYYLGGNEEELLGRSSQQHTKMTRSGKPSEDVEPLQNTEVSRCTELSHETEQARLPENAPVQKRISAKMRKEIYKSLEHAYRLYLISVLVSQLVYEYRSNVLRSNRSLERTVISKLITSRLIGKADGLVMMASYLIADTT